jgi:tetratricopeptide (TPR) repeat protein
MVGEPGMGKSRLVHEFTRHQLPADWLVLESASVSYGKATPYFPLIEMLRRYFQIPDGATNEGIRERVLTHVFGLDNMLNDGIPPVLSLLGALPDEDNAGNRAFNPDRQLEDVGKAIRRFHSMDAQQRRRYTLDAVRRICVRESRRQKLMLVFEDLHWIDHETQAFLDGIIESIPLAHIMLVVNYRPEYKHAWSAKTYYNQIKIDPLEASSAHELLSNLLGSNRDLQTLKELLLRRTEGNPFFAEECVRSLVESGVLAGEKGAYRPGLKIDDLVIPSTVQNVVADRIDRLSSDEKHLLQTAAVIGVAVPFGLLRAVSELSEEILQISLSHLQAAEFLYETSLFPELEYTFKHALVNEVAYGTLLQERRKLLHSYVVAALESMTEGASHDHLERLARHAFQGELWDKAIDYLEKAGAKAARRSANRAAVDFFQNALTALEHLPRDVEVLRRAIDIRLDLRNPLFLLGQFDDLHRSLREAEAIAERIGDHKRLGRVLNFVVGYYGTVGDHQRSVESGTRALEINRDDLELNTVTHYYMGVALHHMGQYDRSIAMLNRALSVVNDPRFKYERFGTATVISVICRSWLTQCFAQLGRFSEGISTAETAIRIAEESEHPYSLAYAFCSLGFSFLLKGDLERAISALERSQKVCESSEIRVLTTQVGSNLGYAYALADRVCDAIPLMEKADAQSEMIGRKAGWALRLTWLAHVRLLEGRSAAAREQGQRALALARDGGERGYQAWAYKLLGDVLQEDSSDPAEALGHYAASMDLATELAMRPLQAHIHLSMGRLHACGRQIEKAKPELSLALASYRSMEMPLWERAAEQELSMLVH